MKRLFLITTILLTACSGQTGKNESAEDSITSSAEIEEEKYVPVSAASDADIIDFVADGSYSPLVVTKGKPQEIWKCTINARMEREGMVCRFKVHKEVWDNGSSKCKSKYTDDYNGHWTIKATFKGRREYDWYYYSGVNDKGDKFVFRVLSTLKEGNTEMRSYPMNFVVHDVEMFKYK